jgi:hypothetical protein
MRTILILPLFYDYLCGGQARQKTGRMPVFTHPACESNSSSLNHPPAQTIRLVRSGFARSSWLGRARTEKPRLPVVG